MHRYEIMYILDKKVTDLNALHTKLYKIIKNNNGVIEKQENWGIKQFSYPIKKQMNGYYFIITIQTTNENINEFIKMISVTPEILRIIIINLKKEKKYLEKYKFIKKDIKNVKLKI